MSASDDSPYLDNAMSLLNHIIASNSTNVDTVSGATFSSVGLIEAVRNALANAGADSGNNAEETTPVEVPKGRFPYPDGVYLGSGEGYRGETTVAVSLKDGTIDNIMVMNTEDDAAYFKRAESLLKQVLQQQTTDLDAISGATFSSEGILEAIVDALEQAKQANSGNQTTTVTTAPIETTTTKPVETTEPTPSLYIDGEYIGSASCYPDDDEDFLPYDLTVKVCIENDQIISITDVEGFGADYDSANDWYIDRALNGTKKISGIAAQILAAQTTDVDAVSGATCSSDAILAAVQMRCSRHYRRDKRMQFWIKLCNCVLVVGLLCGYQAIQNHRTQEEEIAKLEAQLQQQAIAAEDTETVDSPYQDGVYEGKHRVTAEQLP